MVLPALFVFRTGMTGHSEQLMSLGSIRAVVRVGRGPHSTVSKSLLSGERRCCVVSTQGLRLFWGRKMVACVALPTLPSNKITTFQLLAVRLPLP